MENKSCNTTSLTVKQDTFGMLLSFKSCYQLIYGKTLTYDEIIKSCMQAGLETRYPKIAQIMSIVNDAKNAGEGAAEESPETPSGANE